MDGLFVSIVLLLLAAPVIGIVALIRSITDRNLLLQLDSRVRVLEGVRVAAGAATPARAEPAPAPATIVARTGGAYAHTCPTNAATNISLAFVAFACPIVDAASDRLRGKIRHALGGLGRRRGAGARRYLSGALYDPAGLDRSGGADFSRRLAGACAGRRRRMVAAHREAFDALWRAVGAYSRHADRGRHHGRLCHRLCGVRALRIPATGSGFHPARRRGAAHLGRRIAAWTCARRPGRDRRLSGADAGCLRPAGFLVAVCLHRRRQCGRVRAGAVSHVALARHRGGRAGRAVDAAGNSGR